MNKIADDQLDEDFYSNYKQKSYISNSILSERLRNLRRESGKRSLKASKTTNSRGHEKPSFHTERYSILSLLKGSLIDFNVAVDTSHVAIDMDKCKSVLINQLCSFTVDTKDNSQQGSVKVVVTSESKLLEMVFLSAISRGFMNSLSSNSSESLFFLVFSLVFVFSGILKQRQLYIAYTI